MPKVPKELKTEKSRNGRRRTSPSRLISIIILLIIIAVPLYAHEEQQVRSVQSARIQDISFDQRLGEQIPLDLEFYDEAGRSVQLGNYFGAKPVILVLAYYECPRLCPLVLDGLASSLQVLSLSVGDQFTVVTLSIDPTETPAIAKTKKDKYIQRYARPGAAKGWHFLTGEETSIKQLTEVVGFRYTYDPKQDQYAHTTGIIVITPEGKISRYFYGIEFSPKDLRLGLVEASANKIGSWVDQMLLLCYHYDPATGKYSAVALNFLRLGGVITVAALGGFIFVMLQRERSKKSV